MLAKNRELNDRLVRQRRSAESLGYEISHRFLAVLEGLAQHPDVKVGYTTMQDGEPRVLPANQVAGLFAAILLKYREVCDWTPLADEREKVRILVELLSKAAWYLDPMKPLTMEIAKVTVAIALNKPLDEVLKQRGDRPPDPANS